MGWYTDQYIFKATNQSLATSSPLQGQGAAAALSLSKHWLQMTLHSITQLSQYVAASNQQQQKYSMGKINAKMLPAFLQMSHTACLFVLAYVTLRI